MMYAGNKLNRSSSESDLIKGNFDGSFVRDHYGGFEKKAPLVKRFLFVEEIIHDDSARFVRSRSCCEVTGCSTTDYVHNLENLFATKFALNSTSSYGDKVFNPSVNTPVNINNTKCSSTYINDSITPIEVDALPYTLHNNLRTEDCVDFIETMDIDADNYASNIHRNLDNVLKKRYFNKKEESIANLPEWLLTEENPTKNETQIIPITKLEKKEFPSNIYILTLATAFLLALFYMLLFHNFHLSVNSEMQLQHIQKDLLEKVYGQKTSVNVIVRNLQERKQWKSKIKILSFIGSTGVGKTFVANLIKKHFHQGLIHELYGIQLSYKSQWDKILDALNSCCLNLIIIDDLKKKDTTDLFALIHSLPQNQFILVISIFNIQYSNSKLNYTINSNDIVQIRNEFDNSGLYHEIIFFEQFSTEQVKDWLEQQLKFQNVDSSLQQKIINNVLEGHEAKYEGLKGLHSKMLLLLEKYNH